MELKGEQKIKASREQVFAALNDPAVLKECIPGCETLEKKSETEMAATITLKVGPVKAKFAGEVTLSNLNPPSGYTITGSGKAGPAGHAKGGADVTLTEEADGSTLLTYDVKADVGGKIAQLGARLMDSTAKKLSGQFFEKFSEIVGGEEEVVDGADEAALPNTVSEEVVESEAPERDRRLIWLIVIVAVAGILWYFTR